MPARPARWRAARAPRRHVPGGDVHAAGLREPEDKNHVYRTGVRHLLGHSLLNSAATDETQSVLHGLYSALSYIQGGPGARWSILRAPSLARCLRKVDDQGIDHPVQRIRSRLADHEHAQHRDQEHACHGSPRPGGARALGRRPDHGQQERVRDRHPGRPGHPVHEAAAPDGRACTVGRGGDDPGDRAPACPCSPASTWTPPSCLSIPDQAPPAAADNQPVPDGAEDLRTLATW
jgi:hypothetical protein